MPRYLTRRPLAARHSILCMAAAVQLAVILPLPAQAYLQLVPDSLWQPFSNQKTVARADRNLVNYAIENNIVEQIAPDTDLISWETPYERFLADNQLVREPVSNGAEAGEQPSQAQGAGPRRSVAGRGTTPLRGTVEVLEPVDPETATLRQFVRYVFAAGTGASALRNALTAGPSGPDAEPGTSFSVVETVLDSALSAEVVDFLAQNFSPVVTSEVLAAFAASEVGQFIMMFARDTGGLRVIDRGGANNVTVFSQLEQRLGPGGALQPGSGPVKPAPSATLTMGEVLALVHDFVDVYVLNPLTFGAAFFASLIWLVWRLRGGEA